MNLLQFIHFKLCMYRRPEKHIYMIQYLTYSHSYIFLSLLQIKMVFSPLSSLQPRDWHKTIHVRVCRKWEFHGSNENGPLQHIDMVLVDNQVNQPLIMVDACFFTPLELWQMHA